MTVPTLPGFCTPCKRTSRSRVESRASAPTSRKGKTPTGPVGVVSVERRRTSSAAVKSLRGGFFDSRTRLAPSARKSCSASRCFFRSSLAARLSETSGVRRLAVACLRFCRFVHVPNGYATVLARALNASEVDAKLLGFALGGLGGVDLALLFGGLLDVIDDDLGIGADGLNRLQVHVQLLRPALGGLGSLLLPGRLRSGLSGLQLLRLLRGGLLLGTLPLDLDAPLDGVAVQGVLRLRHDSGEGLGLGGGQVGQHLAVQVYLGEPEAVDEPGVRQAMLAYAGVDALDPERPEVSLALLASLVSIDAALPYLLFGPLVGGVLGSPVALGLLKHLAALLAGVEAARRACHGLPHPQKALDALLILRVHG